MTIIMTMEVAYNKHNTIIYYKEGKNDEVKMKTIR